MAEFLFEIGLEEIPARMIASAEAELARRMSGLLKRERLIANGAVVKSYSTPRRLAVLVSGVAAKQDDLAEEMLGPSAKIAFKEGIATPAAVAFAKKAGVSVEELRTVETPKGEYVAATSLKAGRTAAEVISEGLPKELAGIYWAKNMYWRPGKPERFVRPVRWMLALLDESTVPVEFAGYTASNLTYGHRVLAGSEAIQVSRPADYAAALEKVFVLADVEARRHKIRKALDHVCRTLPSTRWREDHELVDKLTHLTEWPSVILGGFEAEYLALPEEVLVTVMRDHQNYFAVESSDGRLAPHFLAVLNTVTTAEGEAVIRHGNERVLRARFNDARFFWEFDQRVPLLERVELLKNVTFQKDLGSYAAKTERVVALSDRLATVLTSRGIQLDHIALKDAASLAKTDLTAELVKEFTELQGIVGGLYATAQGFSDATAHAIYDQYRPVSMEAPVPRTIEGSVLAIADKADTIAGMFGLGLEPTGSKDPFALRRAANGIVKILAESGLPLTIADVVGVTGAQAPVSAKIVLFFAERMDFYLREMRGFSYDVVKAVLGAGGDDVRDDLADGGKDVRRALALAEELTAMRGSEDFLAVCASFKRMKNILVQADYKDMDPKVRHDLWRDPSERALTDRSYEVALEVPQLIASRHYKAAIEAIVSMRPQIDSFFDSVMVMAPEPEIQDNRLALLALIFRDFRRIADFSEIVVAR